jgi:hypothetical protein
MRRETRRLGVTGTVHWTKLLKISPRAGRGSTDGEAQHRDRRSDSPSHISHCAQSVQTLVSPIDPVIFIATSPNRPVAATCFPDECGRILGHPRLLSPTPPSGYSPPCRASQHASPPAADPRVLRVHRPPHAVVVALDATLSPRACRGMLLDSYGGCRPPPRRVSLPYVLLESPLHHAPADLMPTRPAPHTHSLPMALSVSLQTTSSLLLPT